jgi:cytochrome P450
MAANSKSTKKTNCSMVNLCLRHNPSVLGPNHNIFNPSRFLPESPSFNPSHANLLLHFGQGPRQCIGRNIAMMSIWEILVALLKNYEFELVDRDEKLEMLNVGVGEKKRQTEVRVRRRIA